MSAKLVKKSWLSRTLVIMTPEKDFLVETYVKYDGRGFGREQVYVDKVLVSSIKSWIWFTPMFKFYINGQTAILEVRVSPWLTLQSFRLYVNGALEYADGSPLIRSDGVYIWMSLIAFLAIWLFVLVGLMLLFRFIL